MTDERFAELLHGPLHHPLVPFVITRLTRALQFVVTQTGPAGEQALEQFCAYQDDQDRQRTLFEEDAR